MAADGSGSLKYDKHTVYVCILYLYCTRCSEKGGGIIMHAKRYWIDLCNMPAVCRWSSGMMWGRAEG
jgi:hypothetical protein